jgi:4-hydroxybenzoate polyprenyltransferase
MNWTNACRVMRLDKPIGSLLLLWPTLWALWIASSGLPDGKILIIFCLGVLVMRSAGCVINDIADRHYDGLVKRTKNRPLATGAMRLSSAIWLFLSLCAMGLLLALQLNLYTIKLSVIGLILAVVYPFMKRFIAVPQLVLGAAYAWSVPMAFAAVQQKIPTIAWILYGVAVIWPVAYDSIYALMDREDDIKIGIKSTAILFGSWDRSFILLLQALVLAGLLLTGIILQLQSAFYVSLVVAAYLVCYQAQLLRSRTDLGYYRAFYNNHWLGLVVFLGISCQYLI